MFRTVPLSIIGSFSLYTQEWYMSYRFADNLRAGSGRNWFRPDLSSFCCFLDSLSIEVWSNLFLLGAFAKFRKASIGFFMSIRHSVRPHGISRLPPDGFSLNLIFEYFSKSAEKNKVALKSDNNKEFFT